MRQGWTRAIATLVSVLVSSALLAILYRTLDLRLVVQTLLHADLPWLVVSVGMIVPITYLRAVRFYWVAPAGALPGTGEAFRLTLVASALNVFVPAKAGDFVKGYFVATRSTTPVGVAVSMVVYERLCDLFSLIAWCLVGWLVGRPQVAGLPVAFWFLLAAVGTVCLTLILSERATDLIRAAARRVLPRDKLRKLHELADGWPGLLQMLQGRRQSVVLFSLGLWLTHLIQIWLFTLALSASVPFTVTTSLSAIALMAGQVPFTIAGLGARDVVLVVLLGRYMTPESAAAMGVLIATRGLLPPLMGLPIMRPYLSSAVADARRWRMRTELL
jgi:glycosyltransferase 2 family protein